MRQTSIAVGRAAEREMIVPSFGLMSVPTLMTRPARFAITTAVWRRLQPTITAQIATYVDQPFSDSLRSGRWRLGLGLARAQHTFASDAETAAVAKVNQWLALDLGHGPDAIRAEVEAWDTSALDPTYRLARLILLHHDDRAVHTIGALLADGTLDPSAVLSWPLFDRLHRQGLLAKILTTPAP